MRTFAKRGVGALFAVAMAAALFAGVGTTFAYFTTYAEASGGHQLSLGQRTEVTEQFDSWTKHITIANNPAAEGEASQPVFVRARAYAPAAYPVEYSGDDWQPNSDGWYYCTSPVQPGDAAPVLDARITGVPSTGVEAGAQFNVVVVYECTPVLYRADGTPYADWANVSQASEGMEGGDGE